jgi:hypothetical protein
VAAAGSLAALGAIGLQGAAPRAAAPAEKPLAFDHKIHVEDEEIECTECHSGAETGVHAGLPAVRECMDCHKRAKGEHPDEPKVREYAKRAEQIPFVQVNRYPGHVYFSHRAHVRFAGMDCQECHGDMASLSEPVSEPTASLTTMAGCMDCHRERQASLECAACHK